MKPKQKYLYNKLNYSIQTIQTNLIYSILVYSICKILESELKAQLDETHPTSQLLLSMCLKLFTNNGLLNSELVTVQVSYSTHVTMP